MPTYEVAVLGGGPGGYVAAIRAAQRGAKTCCIESKWLGGTCLNVGCIPTKAMLRASDMFWHMTHASDYGFLSVDPRVDDRIFAARVGQIVTGLRKGVESLLSARKVDVIWGRGRLAGPDTILVENSNGMESVKAKSVILATGSRPILPGFVRIDRERIITTDEATTLSNGLPESVIVIGGGVIGCEFATVYGELRIPTTIVEMKDRLVANLDKDVSVPMIKSLKQRGVKIHIGKAIVSVKSTDSGVIAELASGEFVKAACALVAVGRESNSEGIGLEDVGVQMEGRVVKVDDRCMTSVEGIYAIGDLAERRHYAHLASRMGIVAADNATGHSVEDDRTVVPGGGHTHPEVGTVGLCEDDARKKFDDIRLGRFSYRASGMARAYGETEGFVKIIARASLGEIVGAVVVGPHAMDVIQEIAVAMKNELTVDELVSTIHSHPTFCEAVLEAAESWLGYPVHSAG